jgi:hypothetical protein
VSGLRGGQSSPPYPDRGTHRGGHRHRAGFAAALYGPSARQYTQSTSLSPPFGTRRVHVLQKPSLYFRPLTCVHVRGCVWRRALAAWSPLKAQELQRTTGPHHTCHSCYRPQYPTATVPKLPYWTSCHKSNVHKTQMEHSSIVEATKLRRAAVLAAAAAPKLSLLRQHRRAPRRTMTTKATPLCVASSRRNIRGLGVLPRSSGKYWQYIGRLNPLRLTKSGIECVIGALSSRFRCQRLNLDIGSGSVSSRRAQRVIFTRIWTFWHPKSKKNARPQGHERSVSRRR